MDAHLPDYYAVLNVARTATQQEISRAYRGLMRTLHPDVDGGRGAGWSSATADLLEIMEAYSVLRDPRSRAEYDTRYDSKTAVHGTSGDSREVPVRRMRRQQPYLLRVSPVYWEPREPRENR